jgi:hypothetical protein
MLFVLAKKAHALAINSTPKVLVRARTVGQLQHAFLAGRLHGDLLWISKYSPWSPLTAIIQLSAARPRSRRSGRIRPRR